MQHKLCCAGHSITDAQIQAATLEELSSFSEGIAHGARALAILETAGGVASPAPSGRLQVRATILGNYGKPLQLNPDECL